ncbi:MAG: hypothetical protein V4722_07000 [Bacteroidota bacterium]
MIFYYDFEGRRMHAKVYWPSIGNTINVDLTDTQLVKELPSDLIFEMKRGRRIGYTIESRDNKRLSELQKAIAKRLQEFANQM